MTLVRCATPGCETRVDEKRAAKQDGVCSDCLKGAKPWHHVRHGRSGRVWTEKPPGGRPRAA